MMGKVLDHLQHIKPELGPATRPEKNRHWRLARDENDIAWLVLDRHDSSANTLSESVLKELDERLDLIDNEKPKALVIRSAKSSAFVAGADITEFRGLADGGKVEEQLNLGHAIFDRIEKFSFPTITVVHGYALGGGFELALATDYRVAIEGASFGFPEVRLGLHPGLGGTFRLTELIDPVEAMTMMLTGSNAHTKKAKKLGIADLVVEERHLKNAINAIVDGKIAKQEPGLKSSAFILSPARSFAARQMRAKTAERASQDHYPAPYALIDLWEEHHGDREKMQRGEIKSFAKLLTSQTAQNLIRVFFLREKLKNIGDGEHGISHVHVIGAGAMGGEIAAWCAVRGFRVSLGDVKNAPIGEALKEAKALCNDQHLSGTETRDALDRLIPDPQGHGIAQADLVIEAVPEKPELKREIYKAIEPRMKATAILATNTSSLELPELATALKNPARFAGVHFFNPVSKMQLVEIVYHDKTEKNVLERLNAFTGSISRLPAPVKSYPGFLVNRALMPYLMEALMLLDEGHEKVVIDRTAEQFGMPMGPIELADQVGLDICLHVAESLKGNLEKPMPEIPDWLRKKVEKGELGRKTGQGFYKWSDGKVQKEDVPDLAKAPDDMLDRLILPMLDACVECLRKGIVEDTDVIDGAMIFATGFAPFRGGPMNYARDRGVDEIRNKISELRNKHGPRFEPDRGWSGLNGKDS
ncbi:MAG: enoyl-CoA hydratase/isomerase family protein [Rhizobiaceae bacterium]|nr:enoyl-CoA hydratase/isomerase family protein [Rhizobiaceae bacterium]